MDLKEYISSDLLLRYSLGQVSSQEKQEVECMSHIYPELKVELTNIQSTLEKVAYKAEAPPPSALKSKIFAEIKTTKQDSRPAETADENKGTDVNQIKLIPKKREIQKSGRIIQLVAVSSIAAALAIGFFAVKQSSAINNYTAIIKDIEKSNTELKKTLDAIGSKFGSQDQLLSFIKSSSTKKVLLAGTDLSPTSTALVYWNVKEGKVLLDIAGLPTITTEQQYQLWALLDGVPIDMGVYESQEGALLEMKMVNEAQKFAITLEPKGGSVAPTMGQLYAMGNV
ncbi:MAG: anti-sigma-K factor RskA [Flavobacteriales bacterium]|jgi:anti-sigma-K factor RskA